MVATAQGFLLLALVNASLTAPSVQESGTLCLECVTLPVPSGDRDVWLVLRINAFEMPLAPNQVIRHSRHTHTFTFERPAGSVTVRLPAPGTASAVEDLETLEVILAQYGALLASDPDDKAADGDLKGRLVLVDEADGEIVGTLGDQFAISEDPGLRAQGKEKDPVVVDIPDIDAADTSIHVYGIPYEQQDMFMKGAALLSRGIVYATGALNSGMSVASSYYITNTKPKDQPLVFSERTRGTVRRVHHISGQAVKVSAKTTALIHDVIGRAVGYVAGSGSKSPARSRPTTPTPGAPPQLPPRDLKGGVTPPRQGQGAYLATPQPGPTPPPLPPRPPLKNRILLSTDLLLTTLENSAKQLVEHGTVKLSESLGHTYGKDAAEASLLVGNSVRNVGVVYIDARGVGRRALLRMAGKRYIRAKLGKRDVVLGVDEQGRVAGAPEGVQAMGAPGVPGGLVVGDKK